MKRLEVRGAVRLIYKSLGVKGLNGRPISLPLNLTSHTVRKIEVPSHASPSYNSVIQALIFVRVWLRPELHPPTDKHHTGKG